MTELAATERALTTALGTIRDHWAALVEPAGSGGVASKPVPRSLYTRDDHDERDDDLPNLDRRIALRHDVTLSLHGWARIIVEDRHLTHGLPLGTDALGLCDLIERHAVWFSGHEAATDATDELTAWAGRVRAAAVPQRREWMPIGTCPLDIDSENGPVTCAGQVRAHPGREPECHKCGTTGSADWWERVMFPDAETSELMLEADVALFVHRAFGGSPIKAATVRQWVKRGVIESSGRDEKGRSLYSRGAIIWAVSQRQTGPIGQSAH